MAEEKKFLDQEGLKFLWSKISLEDYPNNETLIAVINAIDENKADKSNVVTTNAEAIATLDTEAFGEGPYELEFSAANEGITASNIPYDNAASNIEATSVQTAIDEILSGTIFSAASGTDYSTYRIRNVAILDTVPTEMNNGDIALVYVKDE